MLCGYTKHATYRKQEVLTATVFKYLLSALIHSMKRYRVQVTVLIFKEQSISLWDSILQDKYERLPSGGHIIHSP